ncbi:MAG: hypothetical protein NVV82_10865 [Sporocytophaga sp.]|nr:hypothetical protein [Sporocytophaga sp.]
MNLFEAGFDDFGCVLDLYNSLPFLRYHGIEKYAKSRLKLEHDNGEGGRSSGFYSPADSIYTRYLNYCEQVQMLNTLTETEFNSIFNLEFEKNIETYISNSINRTTEYGIGIFSNLFHKFPDKQIPQKIVSWFFSNSTPDSYLLFKVMTSDDYAISGIDFIYKQADINKLLEHFPGKIIYQSNINSFDTYLVQKNST